MTNEEKKNTLHCLKVMIGEEVCEECDLYGTTGTDHCEADCVMMAIKALEQDPCENSVSMEFPDTFEKFAKDYGFKDVEERYTNGSELIPVFRVKQWLKHIKLSEDAVSREAALKALESKEYKFQVYEAIEKLPPVTPKQRTGKWMPVENDNMEVVGHYCSVCDLPMETEEKSNFCPNCGAKMEGVSE